MTSHIGNAENVNAYEHVVDSNVQHGERVHRDHTAENIFNRSHAEMYMLDCHSLTKEQGRWIMHMRSWRLKMCC